MTKIYILFVAAVSLGGLSLGCDESSKPARDTSGTVGNASANALPKDIGETKPDDYQATLLLNDAYGALDRKDFAAVEPKLAEVEKLKQVSPGIGQQVAEIRAKIRESAAAPATSPTK